MAARLMWRRDNLKIVKFGCGQLQPLFLSISAKDSEMGNRQPKRRDQNHDYRGAEYQQQRLAEHIWLH
jgi:hypothetical protein